MNLSLSLTFIIEKKQQEGDINTAPSAKHYISEGLVSISTVVLAPNDHTDEIILVPEWVSNANKLSELGFLFDITFSPYVHGTSGGARPLLAPL